jgi:phosphoglycerate dehydrogenase-like enzyme
MLRLISQVAGTAADDSVRAAHPDVEIVPYTGGEPPPGLRADAFFGGYAGWDDIVRWLDATGVRWVQLMGTGVDAVPPAVYEGRVVTCARGASAVPISEWVMAAILAWAKRFPETWLREPPKHWNFPAPALDPVDGQTLGLVGLGGIGSAIARRALPFGLRVRALRRTAKPSPVAGVEVVTALEDLLADADHVVLAAPATPRTRHLLDAHAFSLVKPGVHVVNIARGALVDQDALRAALDDGRVAMATLDTVDPEPLPAGHWLYSHPRVRMTAHVSWYTPDLQRAALDILVENLGRFAGGEELLHTVDPEEGY